jgi:hypothetical protein
MPRGRSLPAVLLLGLVALAGCADGSSDAPAAGASADSSPTADPSSASPSSTPTPTPTDQPAALPRSTTRAKLMHTAALGSSKAVTPEEKAVVSAWMGYWQAASDTYFFSPKPPPPTLARFAHGKALQEVQDYHAGLKSNRQRGVGWERDHVQSVEVDGDRATVRDCTENFMFLVDEEGADEGAGLGGGPKPPWYDVTGELEKRDGRWVVTDSTSKKLTTSCLT